MLQTSKVVTNWSGLPSLPCLLSGGGVVLISASEDAGSAHVHGGRISMVTKCERIPVCLDSDAC